MICLIILSSDGLKNKDKNIISDDLSVYNSYLVAAQQKCLAHLRRHFKRLLKLPGNIIKPSIELFLT